MAPQLRSKKRPNNCNVRDNDEGSAKKRKLEDIDETLKTTNKKSKMEIIPKCTEEMLKKNCTSIKCTVNLGGTQICMTKLSKYQRNINNVKPCCKSHDSHNNKPSMFIGPFVNILDDRPNEIQLKTRHLKIVRLLKGKSPSSDKYNYNTSIHKLNAVLQQFHPFGIEEYIAPQSVFPSDDPIIPNLTLTELIEQRLNALPTEGKESNLFYHQEQTWGLGNKFSLKEKCILRKKKQDFIYLRTALHRRLIYRYKLTNLTYIEQQFNLRNLLKNNFSLTTCPKKLKKYYNILHTYSLKIVSEYCKIYKVNSFLTKQFLKKARNITTAKYKSSKKYSDCTSLDNNRNILQNNSNDPVSNKVFEKENITHVIKYYQNKCNKNSFDLNLTKYVVILRELVNYNLIKTKPRFINLEYLKMFKSVYIVYKYPNILQTRIRTTGNVIKGDINFGKYSSTCISFNTSVNTDNTDIDTLSILNNTRKSGNKILKCAKLKKLMKSFSIHISDSDLVIIDQILENVVKNYNYINSDTSLINEISDFIISCDFKSYKVNSNNYKKEKNTVYHVDIDDNEINVREKEARKNLKLNNSSSHEIKNCPKSCSLSTNPIEFKFKKYKSNYLTNVIKSWEFVAFDKNNCSCRNDNYSKMNNIKITIRKMKLIDSNLKDRQLILKDGILSLVKNPDDQILLYNSNHNINAIVATKNSTELVEETDFYKNEIVPVPCHVLEEMSAQTTAHHVVNKILDHDTNAIVETENTTELVKENDIDNNDISLFCNSNTYDDVNENNAFKVLEYAVEVAILDSTNKINNNTINNTQSDANLSVMEYNCNNIPYEIPRDIIDFEGNYSEEIFATKYVNDVINKYNLLNNTNFKVEKSKIYIYYKIIRNLKDFIYNYLTFRYNYFSFTNEILSYYLSNTISYEDMYIIMHIVIFSDDVTSKFVSLRSTLDMFELQQCGIQLPINFSEDIDNLFQILIKCFENKNKYSIHDLLILYILQCLKTEIKSMTDDLKTKIVTLMNKALKFVIEPDCDLIEITGENTSVLRLNSHLNLNSNSPIIDDYFMNNAEENLEMQIKNTSHINIETNNVHYGIENLIVSDQIGSDISFNNISDLEKECTGDLISEFHIPINDDSYYNPAVIGNEDPSSQDENPFLYDTNMPIDNAELVSNVLEVNMNFQEISLNENKNLEVIEEVLEDQVMMNDSIIAKEELDKNNTDRVATFDNIPIGFNNAGILLS